MTKILTLGFGLFLIATCFGQKMDRSAITSAGDFATGQNGVSVGWTLGEIFVETSQNEHHLTEGFLQGKYKKPSTKQAIEKIDSPNQTQQLTTPKLVDLEKTNLEGKINIQVFPNPATQFINILVNDPSLSSLQVNLYDLHGRLLIQETNLPYTNEPIILHAIGQLATGTYIVQAVDGKRLIGSKIIVKQT